MAEFKIELFIPGEHKNEPVIYDIIKNFKIRLKIIEASFSAESGWALLIVNGDEEEIEKMFNYLRKKDIAIETR